jgi:prepilin-type N-terminal cleavage/methylation domain-containing protein
MRRGFTLIELLTVIAIIAVIMGIAIGAFFRVRVSQEEKATETTLVKIQNQYEAQLRAVLDNVRDDFNNAGTDPKAAAGVYLAKSMAGGDNRRAKVIWTKIVFRLEFPTTFYEALTWQAYMYSTYGISPKSSFVRGLAGITPMDPTTLTVDQIMAESAVLLYATMAQARRGVTGFNPTEHVGPHAVGTINLYGRDFPVFIDTWGQPIGYIRWALNGAASDLNQPPHQKTNNQGQPIDPQDPEKTLLDSDWVLNANLVNQFKMVVGYDPTTMLSPGFPLNLSPVICSSGRDKSWGIDALFGRLNSDEDDNVYAYRLKGVGRGNN